MPMSWAAETTPGEESGSMDPKVPAHLHSELVKIGNVKCCAGCIVGGCLSHPQPAMMETVNENTQSIRDSVGRYVKSIECLALSTLNLPLSSSFTTNR